MKYANALPGLRSDHGKDTLDLPVFEGQSPLTWAVARLAVDPRFISIVRALLDNGATDRRCTRDD